MTKGDQTFFWYDLETTGTDARRDRIMQFAGQRTTLALEPIGEPVNVLVRLTDDILPAPDAIMITGITPQSTLADGLTELEFLNLFTTEVAVPGTIFVGYNSVRFDDEFMRFLHWRNYHDAYAWQWRDGRSRWDLLDVVRMTRALRPNGIEWPVIDGKATNRLELITKANNIAHTDAHDALSDIQACIDVAKLIRTKQQKLFDYLLSMRDKKLVAKLVETGDPFVYSSGKYDTDFEKTTVAVQFARHPTTQGVLVYDLRHDPSEFLALSPEQLVKRWQWTKDKKAPKRLPIKTLQFNRCPAVAPLSVLDQDSQKRLDLDLPTLARHRAVLREQPDFTKRVLEALQIMDTQREKLPKRNTAAEQQLYDGFVGDEDAKLMSVLRAAVPTELNDIAADFRDPRLKALLLPYKVRNFARTLTDEERAAWEQYRHEKLMDGGAESELAQFMHRLQQLSTAEKGRADKRYLLEELHLYAESILPLMDV